MLFVLTIPCNYVYHKCVIFFCVCWNCTSIWRQDQDSWCRIFVPCWKTCNAIFRVTTCNGCIVCISCLCYIFFTWDKFFLLVSLFYGKYYVTIFIRELSCSPIPIGENFFLNEKKLSQIIFFIKNSWFLFLFFLRFSNRFF